MKKWLKFYLFTPFCFLICITFLGLKILSKKGEGKQEEQRERDRKRDQRGTLSWSCCSKHDTRTKKKTVPAPMRQVVLPFKAVFKRAAARFISIFYPMIRSHSNRYKWLIKTSNRGFLNTSKSILSLTYLLFSIRWLSSTFILIFI